MTKGPFETIEINVGAAAQQDLRCQALDLDGKPIVATRGANVDITFSDADKGAWTFRDGAVEVSRIICESNTLKRRGRDRLRRAGLGLLVPFLRTCLGSS